MAAAVLLRLAAFTGECALRGRGISCNVRSRVSRPEISNRVRPVAQRDHVLAWRSRRDRDQRRPGHRRSRLVAGCGAPRVPTLCGPRRWFVARHGRPTARRPAAAQRPCHCLRVSALRLPRPRHKTRGTGIAISIRHMTKRFALAAVLAVTFITLLASVVLGHAPLQSSDPADGATITTPYTLTATFGEELTQNGSSLVVQNASGAQVASGTVDPTNNEQMTIDLPQLPDGHYTVLWVIGNGRRQRHSPRHVPLQRVRHGERVSGSGGNPGSHQPAIIHRPVLAPSWPSAWPLSSAWRPGLRSVSEPTLTALSALPAPEAVIFDLDGTLVDTVTTRIEAWLQSLRRRGHSGRSGPRRRAHRRRRQEARARGRRSRRPNCQH